MSKFLKFFPKQQQKDVVNDLFGYKEYVAILTQTGTSAPVATVLNKNAPNYLGDVTFTYTGVGIYEGTLTGKLTVGKTAYDGNVMGTAFMSVVEGVTAGSSFTITTKNLVGGVLTVANAVLSSTLITIKVYN